MFRRASGRDSDPANHRHSGFSALMARFRKRPDRIEAFRFIPVWSEFGFCAVNAPIWFLQAEQEAKAKVWGDDDGPYCMIDTAKGRMKVESGDWIIRDSLQRLYACNAETFAATYELA
jgi:hypothetical protein